MALMTVGKKIIVEAIKKQDDGILIPDNVRGQNNQERARVIAVGPGKKLSDGSIDAPHIVVGDIIYFNPFGATKLKHENIEYLVLSEEDILAVEK
jgi:chaperonin GroES